MLGSSKRQTLRTKERDRDKGAVPALPWSVRLREKIPSLADRWRFLLQGMRFTEPCSDRERRAANSRA